MRFFRFTKYVAFTAMLGLLGACDDFLDVNQSPNAVLAAPAPNVLVAAQSHLGFLMGSDIHRYSSLFVQQFSGQGGAGIQSAEYDRYNVTATDMNNVWRTNIYGGALSDMQKLIEQTQTNSPRYAGISKIMQAFTFAITTDAWGDIPFTDALKFAGNVQPKYDKSDAVYTSILALIDSGVEDLGKASDLSPLTDDLIYGGDLNKWRKLANTLKLRLYVHYYPKVSATATSNIATLIAQGPTNFISTAADNFQMDFAAVSNNENPIHQFEGRRPNQFFPSSTLVGLMNTKSDPRRATYFTASPVAGQYTGAGNGTGASGAPSTAFSRMHTYLRGEATTVGTTTTYTGAAPIRMLIAPEYHFILAEYYFRTGNVASATTSLTTGVRTSMQMAGVATTAIDTYVAGLPAQIAAYTASNGAEALLRAIIEEKYVANFGVAVEPWTDWRRTKYPVLNPAANAVLPQIPRVLPYSDLERVANPTNTPERSDLTAPAVFWDPGR
ncbi:SusD/RagB family nutrient-binding outer membrane lipoprotein [Hymenobacter sp. BT188]|uniref:SusD/RagB family nutrient-binding outer membrane lipoprotein n=1 Tax=Hymenobacter sp. BT188 TaxID=2763504 RepID=UPI00165179F9|nr:SusD/RagB family nutrient-binding outer membrane lipoprotein [Hymenobacter sp. BT188]MBC6606594.1 SusD/RagB family nutrient-binding outer membrane lipoprotein [Hymenobacter sp. BT188]